MRADRSERMRKLAETAAAEKLDPAGDLPRAVRKRVLDAYHAFVPAYVEIVRIKDGHAKDWVPESIRIDPEIVEDMRHFFSDYQHIANAFLRINAGIEDLQGIDKNRTPGLYEKQMNLILSQGDTAEIMRNFG